MSAPPALAARLQLGARRVPLILQSEAAECGLACLAMIASYHGHRMDLAAIRRRFPPSARGARLDQLVNTAAALQLFGRPLRLQLEDLGDLRVPCILHWDLSHFVVLVRVRGDHVIVHDPALGRRVYSLAEASPHFTGVALELTPTSDFQRKQEQRSARIQDLWSHITGLYPALGTLFTLSALLQLLVLCSPFYMQFAVDHALAVSNAALLPVLALGFGLLLLFQSAVSLLREYVLLYVGSILNLQMASNLMSQLIRLPLEYFEKRHVGDVLSRFGSLAPIEELLAKSFVTAVLDGLTSVLTAALMLLYSPALGGITLTAVALYVAIRIAFYRPLRQLSEESILAQAKEQSLLIETVRGMQPIKLLGAEGHREGLWQNCRVDSLNAGVRSTRWNIGFSTASAMLFGFENLLVVYVGAQLVLDKAFTVGMLYAYVAYKQQFAQRVSSLIESAIRYRMLDVHLARLSDIVHTAVEPGLRGPAARGAGAPELHSSGESLKGRIELRDVSFRHSEGDPYLLRGVCATIEAGSCVALVGRSGSGKTTLLKLLLGLLRPTEGAVLVDGRPLAEFGIAAYRRQIGSVMQDDQLFEGTIAENISAFDPEADGARIESSARAAQIHDEIAAMPMGFASLIGNMGATLSGGQRQRVLLARAFYRNPRLLVLDEGTANLDPGTLERLRRQLAVTRLTRIFATHQPEMTSLADQVLALEDGRLRPALQPWREDVHL